MSFESVFHPTISSSVAPFSCPQSFPASGTFPVCLLFASGGQSMGASALASELPMNIQSWFPLGWTGWISLQSKGLSRVFSNTTVQKRQALICISNLFTFSSYCFIPNRIYVSQRQIFQSFTSSALSPGPTIFLAHISHFVNICWMHRHSWHQSIGVSFISLT